MKIIFAGTPELAIPTLDALVTSTHEVLLVLTQPDRPAGRGRQLKASAVKIYAENHHIPILQIQSLKHPTTVEMLRALQPDLIIVLAYGLLIPPTILDIPRLGCINVHISLLPRWRGAAPAQRAILAGDSISGITLMQMDRGLDTGDILKHNILNIHSDETTTSLHQRLAQLGATTLIDALDDIAVGRLTPQPQEEESMTYATKIDKAEAQINWELSALQIERMIRAFNPWPIAFTTLNGKRLRLWEAQVFCQLTRSPPGMIINADKNGIDVACGAGILRLKELQWAGGKRQTSKTILNSNNNPLSSGVILGKT